jgi:hypothetical protein
MEGAVERRALMVEKIEKNEGLQDLAEVGRRHQSRDRAVLPAPRSLRNCPPEARES